MGENEDESTQDSQLKNLKMEFDTLFILLKATCHGAKYIFQRQLFQISILTFIFNLQYVWRLELE